MYVTYQELDLSTFALISFIILGFIPSSVQPYKRGKTIPTHGLERGGLKTQDSLPQVVQEVLEEGLQTASIWSQVRLHHCHRTHPQLSKSRTRLYILPPVEEAPCCQGLILELCYATGAKRQQLPITYGNKAK